MEVFLLILRLALSAVFAVAGVAKLFDPAGSEKAAVDFAARNMRFGLIHVDGNHDTAKVLRDVELYFPLLRRGGFLVMDDVSWSSVKPALDVVASKATLLFFESAPTVTELDYAVFWSGRSPKKAELLRQSLRRLREEG